jgi:hypothetical protein
LRGAKPKQFDAVLLDRMMSEHPNRLERHTKYTND